MMLIKRNYKCKHENIYKSVKSNTHKPNAIDHVVILDFGGIQKSLDTDHFIDVRV